MRIQSFFDYYNRLVYCIFVIKCNTSIVGLLLKLHEEFLVWVQWCTFFSKLHWIPKPIRKHYMWCKLVFSPKRITTLKRI